MIPDTKPSLSPPPAGDVSPRTVEAAFRLAFEQSPAFVAVLRGPDHVFQLVNPAYQELTGDRQLIGVPAHDVFPELMEQGFGELLDEVYRTGVPYSAREAPVTLRTPRGGERRLYVNFMYQPARDAGGAVTGIFSHGMDVTETVLARQRAEKLAVQHAAILRHIRDAVVVADLQGHVTYANEAADVLHGGTAWRAMPPDEYFAAYSISAESGVPLEPRDLPLARLLRGEPGPDTLVCIHRPDGEERWVEVDGRIMHDASGAPAAGLVTLRDVTERTRAAREIERGERRYRELFETAPVGIVHVSPDMRWLDVNGRLLAMLGYGANELIGQPVHLLSAGPDDEATRADASRQLAESGTFQVQKRYLRRDGSILHALLTTGAVRDERGRVEHYVGIVQDVGEQLRAAEALRESEQRFRVLVENAAIGVVSTDGSGRMRHANRAFHRMLGYEPGELEGRRFHEVSEPADLPENEALLGRMLAGELDHYTVEKRYLRRSGEVVWARVFVGAVRDAAGRFLYTTTLIEDITEQRAADAALRETEERLRRVVETVSEALVIVSPEGRITFANPTAVRMLGGRLTEGDADLRQWEVVDADGGSIPFEERPVQRVLGRRQVVSGQEVAVATPEGLRAVLSVNAAPLLNGAGELEGAVVTVRDVTRARRSAERIRFQAALLDAVGESVIATDPEGVVTYWNASAERLYGYTADEARGRVLHDLVVAEGEEGAADELLAAVRRGDTPSGDHVARDRSGRTFPVRVTTSPLRDAEGRIAGMVGISSDLSERRLLEAQLQQSQKMEAVGRLAGGIAHDFNNLLSVILATTDLLLLDVPAQDPLREDLREIEAAARRAARLTQQLLAFSRKQVLKPVTLALNDRIYEMEKLMRRVIGEDVEIVLDLDPRAGSVRVDPSQLEQVLLNLLVNARDAMPHGGRVTLATRGEQLAAPAGVDGHADAPAPGRYVCLRVRDTGTGMDEEVRRHVFEPFFTTKEVGKGTGLGLSTVYGIVRQSGGFVEVDSEPGRGSEFRICLPRVGGEGEGAAEEASSAGLPVGRGTVLLVEDEEAVRGVARRILSRAGFEVLVAASGDEALRMGERHASVDVIVTDVVMPGMSGAELAEAFRLLQPGTRVLYMSGYTDDRLVLHGIDGPGSGFIQKPFRPTELVERVRQLIEADPRFVG